MPCLWICEASEDENGGAFGANIQGFRSARGKGAAAAKTISAMSDHQLTQHAYQLDETQQAAIDRLKLELGDEVDAQLRKGGEQGLTQQVPHAARGLSAIFHPRAGWAALTLHACAAAS